ncbi:metallophosphoesterase [Nicoliella spurrieriana]|uniref:Metallophosphoesterase n=1 Tax=Nicoliella spurrieriana TaxID=2925830 RepID=A0A976RS72_9LACO|nr:metallophosphoesterase [Nicoliella spurrieriana]UQS86915.1 metallophosphoesterase [Nicoliella spurrieriana]
MAYRIIQISDPHLHNSNGIREMRQQYIPNDKLQLVFDDIYRHRNDYHAALIVITGDLVHEGNQRDYQHLKTSLHFESHRLGIPIIVTLGNHDRTAEFFRGYLKEPIRDKYYYQLKLGRYDLYCLDTTFKNLSQGYLDADQLQWLSDQLSTSKRSALLFMHHPAAGAPMGNMNFSILQNSDKLYDVIRGHRVLGMFSGHVHFPATFLREGILNAVCDSTAYHVDCRDVHDHTYKDSTSYNIIDIDGDNVGVRNVYLVSDNQFVDTTNGHMQIRNPNFVSHKLFLKS